MEYVLKNFEKLAINPLRKMGLSILESGLFSVSTQNVLKRSLFLEKNIFSINNESYNLASYQNIYVVCVGKAALRAGIFLDELLGSWISDGIVLDVERSNLKYLQSFQGTHPFPSESNVFATKKIVELLEKASKNDLIISFISGGGSSLLCYPHTLHCKDLTNITEHLMNHGADISQLNIVRKHLSKIQGGQFAKIAYPAEVVSLLFSDVPGHDLSDIASGPTFFDESTIEDALSILKKYNVLNMCKLPFCHLKETPKEHTWFDRVKNICLLSNETALKSMEHEAKKWGIHSRIFSKELSGEASMQGKNMLKNLKKGEVLLCGGETTVTVKGKGSGGRNQEFVLGALPQIQKNQLILSCASDGSDHGKYAGGLCDMKTKLSSIKLNLPIESFLSTNNSTAFFEKTEDYLFTGKTGTNVSDLSLAISL